MNDYDTYEPHPRIALLLKQYARDLGEISPSSDLDARIGALVALGPPASEKKPVAGSAFPRPSRLVQFAAAAGIATLAICLGVIIGMKLEHSRERAAANQGAAREAAWGSADLTMWPSDSVSFKIPAEYSPQGTLVAVDPAAKNNGTRYWIDVVVSNDGTFRIERIVPAEPKQKQGGHDGIAPHVQ